jgi:hypothetical protein
MNFNLALLCFFSKSSKFLLQVLSFKNAVSLIKFGTWLSVWNSLLYFNCYLICRTREYGILMFKFRDINVSWGLNRSYSARKKAPSGPMLLSEISNTFKVLWSGWKLRIEWARALAPTFFIKFLFRYRWVSLTFFFEKAAAISIAPSFYILFSLRLSSLKVWFIASPWQNFVIAISPRLHLLIDSFLRVWLTLKNS